MTDTEKPDCKDCLHLRQLIPNKSMELCGLTEIISKDGIRSYVAVTTARSETGFCQPEGNLFQSEGEL